MRNNSAVAWNGLWSGGQTRLVIVALIPRADRSVAATVSTSDLNLVHQNVHQLTSWSSSMYLTQSLHRSVQQRPDAVYSIFGSRTLTNAEVMDRVSRLA